MAVPNISLPAINAFSSTMEGNETAIYILENKHKLKAAITNYGARWVSMIVPDGKGNEVDVVVGFDSLNGYLNSTEAYYGATVGRYANRIAFGKFMLDGHSYELAVNNPPNHLHGGIKGFHAVPWLVESVSENSILMKYISVDGEEGYPGNVEVRVEYKLSDDNEMQVFFDAITDKSTVINLTNHAYFNLNGQGTGNVLDHLLTIHADHFTPIDNTSIPTGVIEKVEGTAFDFREGSRIGARIHEPSEQLIHGSGYDHNFVLNEPGMHNLAAAVVGDKSNIRMEVFTSEPGIQLYTGNFMNDENKIKGGLTDSKHGAFCLETQHFPDSPNQDHFPPVVLKAGEKYHTTTSYLFSA